MTKMNAGKAEPVTLRAMNVFAYGSLMFETVCQRVISGSYASSPAILHGYKRTCVIGESYPAIYSDKADTIVEGVVYFDVSQDGLPLLNDFEGECYDPQDVKLELPDGERLEARAYVLKKAFSHIVSPVEWDADAFARTGVRRFLKRYG